MVDREIVERCYFVLVTLGNVFRELTECHLDVLNEVGVFCLHTVSLPRTNESVAEFTASWNYHTISTERMQPPAVILHRTNRCEWKLEQ